MNIIQIDDIHQKMLNEIMEKLAKTNHRISKTTLIYQIIERLAINNQEVEIKTFRDGKFTDDSFTGIDVFYVKDEEIIELLTKKQTENENI